MLLLENFQVGDLLYGVSSCRDMVKQKIREKLEKVWKEIPVLVDECNNAVLYAKNSYQGENPYFKKHETALKTASYEKVRMTNTLFKPNVKDLDLNNRKIRRACKARLLDDTTNIHFILDKLDIRHCFDRAYSLESSDYVKESACFYDTYTSAELRFVFKHYQAIEGHIKFYDRSNQDYYEVDLFTWLGQRSKESKQALYIWAKDRNEKGKLDARTLAGIEKLLSPPKENEESKSEKNNTPSSPSSPSLSPSSPPSSQRKMTQQVVPSTPTSRTPRTPRTPNTTTPKRQGEWLIDWSNPSLFLTQPITPTSPVEQQAPVWVTEKKLKGG